MPPKKLDPEPAPLLKNQILIRPCKWNPDPDPTWRSPYIFFSRSLMKTNVGQNWNITATKFFCIGNWLSYNQSVLWNTSVPDSVIKKKSNSIAYHFVREGVARDEWRTAYVNTHLNPADLLTKPLPSGEKRTRFTSYILHFLNDWFFSFLVD